MKVNKIVKIAEADANTGKGLNRPSYKSYITLKGTTSSPTFVRFFVYGMMGRF